MDPMQALLAPFGELGPNVSVSVYKLPPSVKQTDLLVKAVVAQAPRLAALAQSGQAKVHGVGSPDSGESLLAIGGLMETDVFEKVHGVLMAVAGVEFVVGVGSGCSTLPRTAVGQAAVGAAARAKAAKPWWKVW
jgi:hypothetical protein